MARDLSAALAPEQVIEIGERYVAAVIRGKVAVLMLNEDETLRPIERRAMRGREVDMAIARWCVDHSEPAGTGTDTLPAAGKLYLPLKAPVRTRGALVVEPVDAGQLMIPEQRRLLETFAALIAIALERVHFVAVAQRTLVDMESERLRNSVLAALSHDLRTPLTALVGLSETLAHDLAREPPGADGESKALAINEQARRTARLVDNLLEMARLESGRHQDSPRLAIDRGARGQCARGTRRCARGASDRRRRAGNLPLVACDAALIERVLVNLIENAAKYTPAGTPIRIVARAVDRVIEVAVEDRGPGLPPGRERAIFDKFTRGERESIVAGRGPRPCDLPHHRRGAWRHDRRRKPRRRRRAFLLYTACRRAAGRARRTPAAGEAD